MFDPTLLHLLILTPFALAVYYLLPRRAQNYWLLVVSYLFYADIHWAFPLVLMVMTGANYVLAQEIRGAARRRAWLVAGIAFNILLLVAAKYAADWINSIPFAQSRVQQILDAASIRSEGILSILLPVGLSFRILEMISYLVDVANDRVEPSVDLLDFALYTAYFPKLIAGPIERARLPADARRAPHRDERYARPRLHPDPRRGSAEAGACRSAARDDPAGPVRRSCPVQRAGTDPVAVCVRLCAVQ